MCKNGVLSSDIPKKNITTPCAVPKFNCAFPVSADLAPPKTGVARVIGVIHGEIVTENTPLPIGSEGVGKIISIDRYQARGFSVGLVRGFEMTHGAILAFIAHDAHNIIATGVTDAEILTAVHAVANAGGGMAVVTGDETTLLPLPVGGLMTTQSAEETLLCLDKVAAHLKRTGTFSQAFGHLSFLSLTVIPHLKITPKGLFDVDAFEHVELLE